MAGSHPSTIGKYSVLSVLGRGGMGIVYKARDPIIDRVVAIKTISVTQDLTSGELRKRLQMEAQSAGRLQHPNIATLYDFGTFGDTPYIVMEYVEGTDLARVIDEKTPLTLPQKLDVLIQIAQGLAYAHELDVVHRDMKPSNVRLTNRCAAKIIDFGLARFDSTRLTRTGFMSGTIAYMSPERIHGNEGASDDVFALGAITYELLTYTRAFPGSTPPEVMMRIISQSPPLPSTVSALPPEIDPVIMKGLERDVSDRYASASALADALAEFRRAPALRAFLASGQGSEAEWDATTQPGRSHAITLTLPIEAEETATEVRPGSGMEETAVDSSMAETHLSAPVTETRSEVSGPATLIEPRARRRRSFTVAGVIAATLVVLAAGLLLDRRNRGDDSARARQSSPTVPTASAPTEAVPETASSDPAPPPDVAGQRLLLAEVQNDLQSLRLDPDERERLIRAQAQAAMAEAEYRDRDYQTTAQLLTSAIRDMFQLRRDHYERLAAAQQTATAAKPPATRKVPAVAERKAQPPAPVPVPVTTKSAGANVAEQPARETPAPITPAPVTPAPAAADPAINARSEIASFVTRLANAYQTRDVAFFREHDAGYNERLASAIRNSPSVSVRMEIESIELTARDQARVTVVRTDRFEARNMPPGVQTVTYALTRSSRGWRIVSMSRDGGP